MKCHQNNIQICGCFTTMKKKKQTITDNSIIYHPFEWFDMNPLQRNIVRWPSKNRNPFIRSNGHDHFTQCDLDVSPSRGHLSSTAFKPCMVRQRGPPLLSPFCPSDFRILSSSKLDCISTIRVVVNCHHQWECPRTLQHKRQCVTIVDLVLGNWSTLDWSWNS